jgi:hypothetical protein
MPVIGNSNHVVTILDSRAAEAAVATGTVNKDSEAVIAVS